MNRSKWLGGLLLAGVIALLSACGGGGPSDLSSAASTQRDAIKAATEALETEREAYAQLLMQPSYGFADDYSPADMRADSFDQAAQLLADAEAQHDAGVKKALDDYKEEQRTSITAALTAVDEQVAEATRLIEEPRRFADVVLEFSADPDREIAAAQRAFDGFNYDDTVANAAKSEFPDKANRIGQMESALLDSERTAATAIQTLDAQSSSAQPNLAIMAGMAETVQQQRAIYDEAQPVFERQVTDLYVRETHTLIDIKVDSWVGIGRTSWDEGADFSRERNHVYEYVQVTPETADAFGNAGDNAVFAEVRNRKFGLRSGVDSSQWAEFGIDPMVSWPSGHTHAEFWLDGIEDAICHKIQVFRDGEPDASGRPAEADNFCSQYDTPGELNEGVYWVEADELLAEAIAMDIFAKGYGQFADEAIDVATPPGIIYVGDESTGEWRQDSDGNSFWHYYGQYAFFSRMIGGPNAYHYRSEYDTWNRDHRNSGTAYYGSRNGSAFYGASSPSANSRVPNSNYTNRNLADASVRGAGPAARSGGPSSGGK